MAHEEALDPDRRFFMTRILPGCALACAGWRTAMAAAASPQVQPPPPPALQYKHKFDMPFSAQLTFRDHFRLQYEETVKLIRALTGEIGKANLMQMLKTISEQRSLVMGNSRALEVPVNDFATFIKSFRDPGYQQLMTMEIVEDTPTTFEIRITECLWASTFQKLEAADIGYLYMCHADYTWAEGFNPAIKLAREQTLMQGHAFCNHRYSCEG